MSERFGWLFYLTADKKTYDAYLHGDLYAYALEKKLAKKFMADRDMKKFRMKKIILTDQILTELTDKFQGGILKTSSLRTRVVENITGEVQIVCTANESSMIFSTEANFIYRPNSLFNVREHEFLKPRMLKEKYKYALDQLSYGIIVCASKGDLLLLDSEDMVIFDQLVIFLKLFGGLFHDHMIV